MPTVRSDQLFRLSDFGDIHKFRIKHRAKTELVKYTMMIIAMPIDASGQFHGSCILEMKGSFNPPSRSVKYALKVTERDYILSDLQANKSGFNARLQKLIIL